MPQYRVITEHGGHKDFEAVNDQQAQETMPILGKCDLMLYKLAYKKAIIDQWKYLGCNKCVGNNEYKFIVASGVDHYENHAQYYN